MDPVSWDGNRRDVSIASESVNLADYEVLWNGRNPNSARTVDGSVVWAGWAGDADPINMSDEIFQIGLEMVDAIRLTCSKRQVCAASSEHVSADLTSNFPSCLHTT